MSSNASNWRSTTEFCLQTGDRIGLADRHLAEHADYAAVEAAVQIQPLAAMQVTRRACAIVEPVLRNWLPSPFLSCVIDDCIGSGLDVTAGGARYNLAGIQAIQLANVADSLAVVRELVFEQRVVDAATLVQALRDDWDGHDALRARCIHRVPKYGNGEPRVDAIAVAWAHRFADILDGWTNARGGATVGMGLYTVSAHVPMGAMVSHARWPAGRCALLADGGVSPTYGRDQLGPTAVLQSVARLPFERASNGTLLNQKFLPEFFQTPAGIDGFAQYLQAWCALGIGHAQFNVLRAEDLRAAQAEPDMAAPAGAGGRVHRLFHRPGRGGAE